MAWAFPKSINPDLTGKKFELSSLRIGHGSEVNSAKIYHKLCAKCHGVDGKGKAAMVKMLKLKERGIEPLDLLKAATRDLKDKELMKTIVDGKKGTKMNSFKKKLAKQGGEEAAAALVRFIRDLQKP